MYKLRDIILEQSVNPKALILAGSPGAGKSSFIEGVKDALILNVDDFYMRNLKDLNVSLDLKTQPLRIEVKLLKQWLLRIKNFVQ
jgi:predicted kinase